MSKVDLTLFEELAEEYNISLSRVIYELASGNMHRLYKLDESSYGYDCLDTEGGYEGSGEYCYGVFSLKGKTYKAEWSYYSYDGCEYDDIEHTLKEVKPVEKLITVWE